MVIIAWIIALIAVVAILLLRVRVDGVARHSHGLPHGVYMSRRMRGLIIEIFPRDNGVLPSSSAVIEARVAVAEVVAEVVVVADVENDVVAVVVDVRVEVAVTVEVVVVAVVLGVVGGAKLVFAKLYPI